MASNRSGDGWNVHTMNRQRILRRLWWIVPLLSTELCSGLVAAAARSSPGCSIRGWFLLYSSIGMMLQQTPSNYHVMGWQPTIKPCWTRGMTVTSKCQQDSDSEHNKSTEHSDDLPSKLNNHKNQPRRRGFPLSRITGDGTPYQFVPWRPVSCQVHWANYSSSPFTSYDFSRMDTWHDGLFYGLPRLVYHVDEPAVCALVQYYRTRIAPQSRILDIGSSWTSHYPTEFPDTMQRIAVLGMNAMELYCNDQVVADPTQHTWDQQQQENRVVLDLNQSFPFADESFDVVTCALSIEYLVNPIAVLQECHRVLRRPGGKVIVSFSTRCFATKAIHMYLRAPSSLQHVELVNGFFHFAGGYASPRDCWDITPTVPPSPLVQLLQQFPFLPSFLRPRPNPIYVVEATTTDTPTEPSYLRRKSIRTAPR